MNPPAICAQAEAEIGVLPRLSRPELVERWQMLYGGRPPKGLSRRLLILAIAYRMQANRYGGLTAATRRKLGDAKGNGGTSMRGRLKAQVRLAPGTRLIREWNGATHVVDVAAGHFVWNGSRYRSLSAVARAITGARWSGPRFFGLKSDGAS